MPGLPLLVYDRRRDFMRHVSNTEGEAYKVMESLCPSKGLLGGKKIYLWAKRQGKEIRVFKDIPKFQQEIDEAFNRTE
jgi:hypothetical protein